MSYIGRGTDKISNIEKLDTITFDGSSSYTLQKNSVNFTPNSANSLQISIDGVVQAGNFTVSGSTIDFGVAIPATSTNDFIFHYGTGLITTPADGTVTTAKLADSSVTTAKLNDASVSLAKLTATGTKDSTTFLRGDNTFAEAGGGAMELLTTVNQTSSVSSISVDGFVSSTYFAYKIFIQNVSLSTDPLWIYLRVNQSGSAITSSSYYSTFYGRYVKTSPSASSNDQDAATFVKLTETHDTASGDNMLLEITLSDFNQTSKYKYGSFNSSSHYNDVGAGGEYVNVNGGFEFRNTGACSGFTLFRPSGNIDNMDIKVYGIKG